MAVSEPVYIIRPDSTYRWGGQPVPYYTKEELKEKGLL